MFLSHTFCLNIKTKSNTWSSGTSTGNSELSKCSICSADKRSIIPELVDNFDMFWET